MLSIVDKQTTIKRLIEREKDKSRGDRRIFMRVDGEWGMDVNKVKNKENKELINAGRTFTLRKYQPRCPRSQAFSKLWEWGFSKCAWIDFLFPSVVHNILLVDLKRGWGAGGVAPAKVAIIGYYWDNTQTKILKNLLKLVSNSSSLKERYRNREEVWISDLDKHRFFRFYLSGFLLRFSLDWEDIDH